MSARAYTHTICLYNDDMMHYDIVNNSEENEENKHDMNILQCISVSPIAMKRVVIMSVTLFCYLNAFLSPSNELIFLTIGSKNVSNTLQNIKTRTSAKVSNTLVNNR